MGRSRNFVRGNVERKKQAGKNQMEIPHHRRSAQDQERKFFPEQGSSYGECRPSTFDYRNTSTGNYNPATNMNWILKVLGWIIGPHTFFSSLEQSTRALGFTEFSHARSLWRCRAVRCLVQSFR